VPGSGVMRALRASLGLAEMNQSARHAERAIVAAAGVAVSVDADVVAVAVVALRQQR
jgi:hypothetical protein